MHPFTDSTDRNYAIANCRENNKNTQEFKITNSQVDPSNVPLRETQSYCWWGDRLIPPQFEHEMLLVHDVHHGDDAPRLFAMAKVVESLQGGIDRLHQQVTSIPLVRWKVVLCCRSTDHFGREKEEASWLVVTTADVSIHSTTAVVLLQRKLPVGLVSVPHYKFLWMLQLALTYFVVPYGRAMALPAAPDDDVAVSVV